MRPLLALALLAALLMAGCAGDDKTAATPGPATAGGDEAPAGGVQEAAKPMRFATGDYEGGMAGTSTFSITAQCAFDCQGGEDVVDLTSIVPANAPVEMSIQVFGANALLELVDTYGIGLEDPSGRGTYDGSATTFGPILIRGESGQVLLHVYNPGGFGPPPEPAPTADWVASSVVRADLLVPGVPATMTLQPGDLLNVTGPGIDQVLLLDPAGGLTSRSSAPFQLTANGTAGAYTIILLGQEAATLYGPDVPMDARRIVYAESEAHPLASGTPVQWTFSTTRPLIVGVELRDQPTADVPLFTDGLTVGTAMLDYDVHVTAPGNVEVVGEADNCMGMCVFSPVSAGLTYGFASDFLDEHLAPGEYAVSVRYTGNGMEAVSWAVTIV